MAKLSRKGDKTQEGGQIQRGSSTVFANGIAVGLHTSEISDHPGKHKRKNTTEGSPTVFADNEPVLRVGSGVDCGHSVIEGSPDIEVP